jgi:hypothetical protein
MDWSQVATILGVNVGVLAVLSTLIVWSVNRMDADVKSICLRMDKMDSRFESHSARIDQLYRMFIDLIKEGKK